MSTELTTQTTSAYAIEGLENMGQADIILPRWGIVQPMTKGLADDAPVGWFYNNLTKETAQTLTMIVLRVSHTRTLWSGDPTDKAPECSSFDGVTGRTYGACVACEYSQWTGKDVKYCKSGYMFLCLDPDTEEMSMIGAMGTSVRPAKTLISQFVSKRRPPFSAIVTFNTVKVEGDKGKYWVLSPAVYKWLEPGEIQAFRDRYIEMRGVTVRDAEPDEATAMATPEDDF